MLYRFVQDETDRSWRNVKLINNSVIVDEWGGASNSLIRQIKIPIFPLVFGSTFGYRRQLTPFH